MKLYELKNRIFQMTNHVYQDQFYMVSLINEALTMLAEEAKLQVTQPLNVVAGTSRYPLPADFKAPISLVDGDTVLDLIDETECFWGYAISGNELVLKPEPSENRTLQLTYYAYPAKVSSDQDDIPIDARYADAIAAYAAAMILSLPNVEGGTQNMIERYFARWEEGRQRYKTDMQRKYKLSTVRKVARYW